MASPLDILNGGSPPFADTIVLGGESCPGVATPVKAGSPRNWDKRAGYGISGASLVYTGDDLSEFDVLVDLWLDKHWGEWKSFAAKVLDKPAMRVDPVALSTGVKPLVPSRPKALGIYHPVLAMPPLRITEVIVKDFSQFEQDEYGLWTGVIHLQVYRAPQPIVGKATAPIPAAAKPVPTAQDAADREIVELLGNLRSLT